MKKLFYKLRDTFRFKWNTITKIISLYIGLFVGILTLGYCVFELNYDNFHRDYKELYRLATVQGDKFISPYPFSQVQANLVGLESVSYSYHVTHPYEWDNHSYNINTLYVDSSFIDIFSIDFITEDINSIFSEIDNIAISKKYADILFGNENPIGKQIKFGERMLTVVAIFKKIPANSHLKFDVLAPFSRVANPANFSWNTSESFYVYMRLNKQADKEIILSNIEEFAATSPNETKVYGYQLQPIRKIHLDYDWGYSHIILVGIFGLATLFISCLNYLLIAISYLLVKKKEIGIHKVSGANIKDIFTMFLAETIVLLFIAILLTSISLFIFKDFFERLIFMSYADLMNKEVIWFLFALILFIICITGVIPARIFSKTSVLQTFKQTTEKRYNWKNMLLWVQFLAATCLINLFIIFSGQNKLIMNKNLGYNMDNLYYVTLITENNQPNIYQIKDELARLPFIQGTSFLNSLPMWSQRSMVYDISGETGLFNTGLLEVDEDFFQTFEIPVLQGTNVSQILDNPNHVIVNEKFMEIMQQHGLEKGDISINNQNLSVEGVCQNFQIWSLYTHQNPAMIRKIQDNESRRMVSLVVKMLPSRENINTVNETIQSITGKTDLYLYNYKQAYIEGYEEVAAMEDMGKVISPLAILLVILGLFGFTGEEINRRTKEIAIRKINGASRSSITLLLLKAINIVALLALPFASILSYFIGKLWLEEFAYRISLSLWIFIGGSLFIFFIIIFTVLLKSQKGINAQPAEALKSE